VNTTSRSILWRVEQLHDNGRKKKKKKALG
jgi:hypothetical protein